MARGQAYLSTLTGGNRENREASLLRFLCCLLFEKLYYASLDTLAARYQARRQAEAVPPEAQQLVERQHRETKEPAEVVAALQVARALAEPFSFGSSWYARGLFGGFLQTA